MVIDLRKFFQATNPSRTLIATNAEDQPFYIDFSSVRGGKIIEELKDNITFFSPDEPTCVLFTGHIGCGKSTELLRLKAELEQEKFHVVYFASSEDLEMADVDIGDVLLAIAHRVSQSLEALPLARPDKLTELLQGAAKLLLTEIELKQIGFGIGLTPGMPGVGLRTTEGGDISVALGIGAITAKAKSDSILRERLNQYLAPQKNLLLDAINQELLEPAIAKLKAIGKLGLVVIVDNLDLIDNRPKPFGRSQQEYLFVDQGECLAKLHCHLVYTMPLALKFSHDYGLLTQRFEEPKVLPMVPVQYRDGQECVKGMELLRQMVLARAFPMMSPSQREAHVLHVFESAASLDRLCRMSGGHVRDLLRLLNEWIKKGRRLPLPGHVLEDVIRARRNEMTLAITDEGWKLLRQVRQRKKVSGDQGYQALIRSRLVFEYRDRGESWFDVNPILLDAEELQPESNP